MWYRWFQIALTLLKKRPKETHIQESSQRLIFVLFVKRVVRICLSTFYLLPEIIEFSNLKKCLLMELEQENQLRDLGLMVNIIEHLNDSNVQLQLLDQLLH